MIESPLALLSRLPRVVRILIAGILVNRMGAFIVPYLSLVLRREFRLSAETTGLLMAGYGVGSVVSILAGGSLTDRLGRRRTLLVSLLGGGSVALALAAAPSVGVFIPLLVLFGFLAEMYRTPASALIADALPSDQRAVGFASMRMAINLGFAVGMGIGGLLADWSWRALFLGDGLTTLAFGAVVFFRIPETGPGGPSRSRPEAGPSPWRDRVYLELLGATLLFAVVFFADMTVLPLTITLSAGYPAVVYGALVGTNGLIIALLEVSVVGSLSGHRRLRIASLGMLVTGVGFALNGLGGHWTVFLAGVLVWTAGEILSAPQTYAFVADWAPPEARGRYLSAYAAIYGLAWALNPITLLPLHELLGERLFWPCLMLMTLPAAAVLRRLDRIADKPERLRGRAAAVS